MLAAEPAWPPAPRGTWATVALVSPKAMIGSTGDLVPMAGLIEHPLASAMRRTSPVGRADPVYAH